MVIPAFNEELLIEKTVRTLPSSVDYAIVVNDGSSDRTAEVLSALEADLPRLTVINLPENRGIGYAIKTGYHHALSATDATLIGTMAGDAQCDPDYIDLMLDEREARQLDFVKASRFRDHDEALEAMPTYRRIGNRFISSLTQLATGYYNVTDSQNGYGFFTRDVLSRIDWDLVGDRYDYENTMLVALAVVDARVGEVGVPAIYGDETSTIKFWPTTIRALGAVRDGFAIRFRSHVRHNGADPFSTLTVTCAALGATGAANAVSAIVRRNPRSGRRAATLIAGAIVSGAAAVAVDRQRQS